MFRYLSGMCNIVLMYRGEKHNMLGFIDTDEASHKHHRAILCYTFIIDKGAAS